MLYEENLRKKEKLPENYQVTEAKELEVRTNNPYVDIEAYFYNVSDENGNFIVSYEVEVVTKTSSNSETIHIKRLS